jgi:hypothetical protein
MKRKHVTLSTVNKLKVIKGTEVGVSVAMTEVKEWHSNKNCV